jgi:cyclopropane fatty-acyl-phospholipid synthase-like methyltransferase
MGNFDMPTSYPESIPKIVEVIQAVKPRRILDIGVGRGKYGLLAQEYCDGVVVDGVEAWPGYITDIQRAIYRKIYLEDITKMDLDKLPSYDLVLMVDVIEHFSKEDAYRIIDNLKTQVIVSTPIEDYRAHYDNHFEDHISHWIPEDFNAYPNVNLSNNFSTIMLIDARVDGNKKSQMSVRKG